MTGLLFPPGFRWGAATAAYQIEGGWNDDGKGPSVWDTLAHRSGGFAGGATGDVACDHYHRLDEDLELIAKLGLTSYRFSISWPRVQPTGRGGWNPAGVAFYDRLLDGLLSRGIEPTVTLYHWDHPQALEDGGGWMNPDTAHRFADYAAGIAERLGDRVPRWITLNEPLSVFTGQLLGFSRPAGPLGRSGLPVAHQLLLAHGLAVSRLREVCPDAELGITLNFSGVSPGSDDPADRAAAARAEAYEDRLFLDPLLTGRYPAVDAQPLLNYPAEDMAVIGAKLDFLGVNWYTPARVVDPSRQPQRSGEGGELAAYFAGQADLFGYTRAPLPGAPMSAAGWPIAPEGFATALQWLRDNYPNLPPVYVTENGLSAHDQPDLSGAVHDPGRISYLASCLAQIRDAIDAGMDIRGYFVWSLMDNLEWLLGFAPRFGLIHVDFDRLVRTPKDSYYWYQQLIANQPHSPTAGR
jgi:beta-glucosidase